MHISCPQHRTELPQAVAICVVVISRSELIHSTTWCLGIPRLNHSVHRWMNTAAILSCLLSRHSGELASILASLQESYGVVSLPYSGLPQI